MSSAIDEFQFFLEKEWSDGFPVVTPTEERVAWMLARTRCDPEEVIGYVPPAGEQADVILHTVGEDLRKRYGVADVVFRRKEYSSKPASAQLIEEMAARVQVAIAAVGG